MSYLAAAQRTADWLLATAERSPEGWCRPRRPGVSAEVDPGLGWGTAAPKIEVDTTDGYRPGFDEIVAFVNARGSPADSIHG